MAKENKDIGKLGEKIAAGYLRKNGFQIVEKNFHKFGGEIDVVAIEKETNTLVFVEVKTRRSEEFGFPEEAVDWRKLNTVLRCGQYYKLLHPELPELMRIDVIAIKIDYLTQEVLYFRHIKNAADGILRS